MKKTITLIALLSLAFVSVLGLYAQDADPFNTVLQTLSSSLNTPITEDMLDNYSWSEVTFNNTSLGCPIPGQTYQSAELPGYQVYLIYNAVLYDYRVTADAQNVVLCATSDTTIAKPQTPVTVIEGQPVPETYDVTLQTLNAALNTAITRDDLDEYTWTEVTFPNSALGCPQPGQAYAAVLTRGYQIILVYNGVQYDYRVSANGQNVVLCSAITRTLNIPQPPVINVSVQSTQIQPVTSCTNGLMPRLAINEVARTTPQLGSHIRETPDLNSAELGLIPESTTVLVVDGPQCGPDGYMWWLVNYNGVIGWTIQGQEGLYYIEPIPQPLPIPTDLISSQTATSIIPLSQIEGNILGISAWSPDGQTLAIADASTAEPAIWLYSTTNLEAVPTLLTVNFDTTALAFSPDGSLLAVGDPEGNVHLIDLSTYTIVHSFVAHDTAVLDIDFSPNGMYMVVIDDNYTATFFGVVTTS